MKHYIAKKEVYGLKPGTIIRKNDIYARIDGYGWRDGHDIYDATELIFYTDYGLMAEGDILEFTPKTLIGCEIYEIIDDLKEAGK